MSISTFDIHTGTVLMADTDYRLRSVALRPRDSGMVRRLAFTGGYVWVRTEGLLQVFSLTLRFTRVPPSLTVIPSSRPPRVTARVA